MVVFSFPFLKFLAVVSVFCCCCFFLFLFSFSFRVSPLHLYSMCFLLLNLFSKFFLRMFFVDVACFFFSGLRCTFAFIDIVFLCQLKKVKKV